MVEIVFLGTGGGRVNLISQARRTGGFRINGSLNIHVDPGPGALISGNQFGQDARSIDLLVVTHNHIDHVNDAGLLVEAMSNYALGKKGGLIGSRSVIIGDENNDRGISNYHLSKLALAEVASAGKEILFGRGKKSALFIPTKVRHEDKTGFGFVLQMDGKKIGYTSDTEYFNGISAQYPGCDLLIANNIKSGPDNLAGHLHSAATIRLLSESAPKLAVITHIGMKLMQSGPEKEAEKISRASGVQTLAAYDGMSLKLP